jgi:lipopolysaccharide transport system ATP-binding protein
MSDIVIRVENLSKRYRLGSTQARYGSLRESLVEAVKTPLRRLRHPGSLANQPHHIWALKDISFEVPRSEALGIIGRNGAGKSTLLKILSRITRPTEGRVRLRGRVGSLLEVGTGFHPELTGRENIYLNGAILGMRRSEIERKFDEIVAFAEIEQFLDTPVKHYSSGMYMRLAFAVAAHLEPEILLVDEVLAVGDAAFQKKCLGKMGEVTHGGRTVLFVSHNMGAINALCNRSILLDKGTLKAYSDSSTVINTYLSYSNDNCNTLGEIQWNEENGPSSDEIRLHSICLSSITGEVSSVFRIDRPIIFEVTYQILKKIHGLRFILSLNTQEGVTVFASTDHSKQPDESQPGFYKSSTILPANILNQHRYVVRLHVGIPGYKVLIPAKDYLILTCEGEPNHGSIFPETWPGLIAPQLEWKVSKIE